MPVRFRPPRDVPDLGLRPEQQARFNAWLRSAFVEIAEDLATLGQSDATSIVAQQTIDVAAGSMRRVTPPTGGMTVRIPAPSPANAGQSVRLMIEAPVGTLTVVSGPGVGDDGKVFQPTINGEPQATFSSSGLVTLTSNGSNDWKSAAEFAAESPASVAISSGGAALDAQYLLRAANSRLPNARVADDSTEIDISYSSPGLITWFLKTASVAFSKLANLAPQRVLGRNQDSAGEPEPVTVHQELDWIPGDLTEWQFDGVDDRVEFADVLDFERSDSFTISAWIQTPSVAAQQVIAGKLGAGSSFPGWEFGIESPGKLYLILSANVAGNNWINCQTPDGTVPVGGLVHVIATYSGTSLATGMAAWVDGVAQTFSAISANADEVTSSTLSTQALEMGVRAASNTLPFTGLIKHFAIWSSALSSTQVAEVYNGGTPPDLLSLATTPDPALWVRMDSDDAAGAGGIVDYGTGGTDGTAAGGLSPGSLVGAVIARSATLWQVVSPGADGLPFCSNGTGVVPSYRQIGLNAIPATAAGSGLTGGDGSALAVGSSTSIIVNANDVQRAALTGFAAASANSNATTSAEPLVTYSASANMSAERVLTTSTSETVDISVAGQIQIRSAAKTGAISQAANANATLFAGIRDNGSAENDRTNLNQLSTTSIIAIITDDAANDELELTHERAALTGDVTASQNSNATTIANSAVTLAKMANLAAGTAIGRQIDAGTGAPVALTGAEQAENFRRSTIQTVSGVTGDTTIAVNDDTTVIVIESTADIRVQAFTGTFGSGREIVVEHVRTSGTGIVRFQHQAGLGGSTVDLLLPGNVDYELGHRAVITMRLRTVFMRFQTASDQLRPFNIASVASNRGIAWEERVAFSATGATGTLVDVTVWNASAPFALRILRAELRVSTAAGTASALRTAAAGAGSVVLPDAGAATQTFDTSATGHFDDNSAATATVAASGSLFFNVDRAVSGEIVLTCVRT